MITLTKQPRTHDEKQSPIMVDFDVNPEDIVNIFPRPDGASVAIRGMTGNIFVTQTREEIKDAIWSYHRDRAALFWDTAIPSIAEAMTVARSGGPQTVSISDTVIGARESVSINVIE